MANFPELYRWHYRILDHLTWRGPCTIDHLLAGSKRFLRLRRWLCRGWLARLENLGYVTEVDGKWEITDDGRAESTDAFRG